MKNNRNVVLIELNPDYIKLQEKRISEAAQQMRMVLTPSVRPGIE